MAGLSLSFVASPLQSMESIIVVALVLQPSYLQSTYFMFCDCMEAVRLGSSISRDYCQVSYKCAKCGHLTLRSFLLFCRYNQL